MELYDWRLGPVQDQENPGARNASGVIKQAAALVVAGKIKDAYEKMKVPGLGPANFTKLLYFIGLSTNARPLPIILDSKLAKKLERLGTAEGWNATNFARVGKSGYVRRYAEGYFRYVKTLDVWSKQLGCPRADHIEYFLFKL